MTLHSWMTLVSDVYSLIYLLVYCISYGRIQALFFVGLERRSSVLEAQRL